MGTPAAGGGVPFLQAYAQQGGAPPTHILPKTQGGTPTPAPTAAKNLPPPGQGLPPEEQPKPEEQKQPNVAGFLNLLPQPPEEAQQAASSWLQRLPRPESLVFPLILIIIFLLLLMPVNGKTRIQWLWEVLTGNASLTNTTSVGSPIGAAFPGLSAGGTPTNPSTNITASQAAAFDVQTDLPDGTFQPAPVYVPSNSIAMASDF